MRFFEKFRTATARYAAGVHDLGEPAKADAIAAAEKRLGRALPSEYRDFLAQWNGGFLFQDDYALFGVAGSHEALDRLGVEGARIWFGETPRGELLLDERGRVLARDGETEETIVEGSGFERWLDALMAREGVVYDREGEFREEAFDGADLSEGAARKRLQLALKADPASPAWLFEEAERLAADDEREGAAAAYERAVESDPGFAAAWFALGKLRRDAGAHDRAAGAFAHAAEAETTAEEAAFAWAHAARESTLAGRAEDAAEQARRAAAAFPRFVDEQRTAAEHLASEGEHAGAIERLSLACAVRPDDDALKSELSRYRARKALKPL